MPRTIKIHPERKKEILLAIERNSFLTQGDLAAHLEIALSTVSNFVNSKPVYISKFEKICEALGLDKREITKPVGQVGDIISKLSAPPDGFFRYDSSWVGREQLVAELSEKLGGSCRLLLILGLTGIGKTALAERLAVELQNWFSGDWKKKFKRANFDSEYETKDFASVAARWLEECGEKLSAEDQKPERLWPRLVKYLQENQVLVLIDSLEALLTGNEEEGWGDFADEWWEKFFVSLLSAESCQSRLIVTSQDLPVKLVDYRYKLFWHRQVLYGLDESEQIALFETTRLDISQESPDRPLLLRIGKAYKGHPLVLRVIIEEICEYFESNVQAYWNYVSSKIAEVEKALAEAEADAEKIVGSDDDWKLHKLTRKVRLEVNKQRLKAIFERLETQVKDAYILICAASVYRAPVQEEGWLMQLVNFVKRLEDQQCNEERKEKALEELCNRFLAEESVNHNNKRVLGQHNLVRSMALEHYKNLLQSRKN
ncbi:helix-turn-helix domain-containing protein [Nostoc sp.]|uniref:helix-turn-helix domain-containing protein n=1 Tax=Nostoc sp. TaxID=1180 RepID=UPI002FFD4F9E